MENWYKALPTATTDVMESLNAQPAVEILYRATEEPGRLSREQKISMKIPLGLCVHNNHTVRKVLLEKEWRTMWLYWTYAVWVVVNEEDFEDGVEMAGRWNSAPC
jgi:hypothetical protein